MAVQSADGGGDYEEAVEKAFEESVEHLEWSANARARILFLLLDAPPHAKSDVVNKMHLYIREAAQKGIRVVPIIASGDVSEGGSGLEYLMRSIALAH